MNADSFFSINVRAWRSILVAAFFVGGGSLGHAANIELAGGRRIVQISGELNAFNFETGNTSSASFMDDDQGLPGDWRPLWAGMDFALPEANFYGQGGAMQSMVNTGESISFKGLADVNISAYPGYPYILEGSGAAQVEWDYQFKLSSAQQVDLFMASETALYQEDDYQFELRSRSGQVIWAQTAIIDGNGDVRSTFTERLMLDAGDYSLSVYLKARSQITNDIGFAGRTHAEFAITVVPEPSTWVLMLYGSLIVPSMRRRIGRRGDRVSPH